MSRTISRVINQCEQQMTQVGNVSLCWFEWGAAHADEGTILLVHATGFHARCWDQTIAHLPGRHVIALDMRGHGRSGNEGPITWDTFGDDLVGFIQALDLKGLVAAGHSMGGHCLVHAAAQLPDRFERLLLIDPVIMDPATYAERAAAHTSFLDAAGLHPVAKRRNHFATPEAMFANFVGRGSFAVWEEAVLRDYCEYGLVPATEGEGYVLGCPPAVEAAVYMGSSGSNLYAKLDRVVMPVTILRARREEGERMKLDFSLSPTFPGLAARMPNARDVYLPELTHFIPMQAPALTADYVRGER
jgi:pimeloyl-ACP methyl ester carboxylesterase